MSDGRGGPGAMRKRGEMAYHYAGRVHVRGLLRRVWRPRYLALGDDGYLRYHESIPPLFQQDPNSARDSYSNAYSLHNTHRPKTVLAILDGARVIDPHSLADQHVALPQGAYGFVFRGRPMEMRAAHPNSPGGGAPAAEGNADSDGGALIVPPENCDGGGHADRHSKKAAVVNLVFPKGTSRRRTAQKIAKKAINPDVMCAFGAASNCVGGMVGRSASSSSPVECERHLIEEEFGADDYDRIGCSNNEWGRDSHESHDTMGSFQEVDRSCGHGDRPRTPPNPSTHRRGKMQNSQAKSTVQVQVRAASVQSREYLCAVSTAAEAESWVVALRWAAEHKRRMRYDNSLPARAGGFHSASVSSNALLNRAVILKENATTNERVNAGRGREGRKKIGDAGNDGDSHQLKSSGKRIGADDDGNGGSVCNTHREIGGDSQADLTSLVMEQDGWCNAEEERKKRDIGNDTDNHQLENTGKRTGANGNGMAGSLCDTHREIGDDSQASLPSLAEQDSWCKAEEEKEKRANDANEEPQDDGSKPSFDITPLEGGSTRARSETPPLPSFSKKHTIVVTKVCRFRLPQKALVGWDYETTAAWLPIYYPLPGDELVLQYEIQLLLLRNCKPCTETSVQMESIEERTIHRSMHDVMALVRNLLVEFDTGECGSPRQKDGNGEPPAPQQKGRLKPEQRPDDTFRLLEDVESNLLSRLNLAVQNDVSTATAKEPNSCPTKGKTAQLANAMSVASASIAFIDDVMRKLSKDCNICSSHRFQEFLCLHDPSPSNKSIANNISEGADAEKIVRSWLARTERPSNASKAQLLLAITLRHELCGPIVSLVAVWFASRLASTVWSMASGSRIAASLPLEACTTLVALSFFVGHHKGSLARSHRGGNDLGTRSTTDCRVPSPKSIGTSRTDTFSDRHAPSPTSVGNSRTDKFSEEEAPMVDDDHSTIAEEGSSSEEGSLASEEEEFAVESSALSSPLPLFPANDGKSCWSRPDHGIFMVRGPNYLNDGVKISSAPAVFGCRGVDLWITDNAERNIARHPSVLGGRLGEEDTFVVNFLLPFGNFVAYFAVPPIEEMPPNVAHVWSKFIKGDQQYRDGKLKLLPVVVDGPWIVKKAVGPGTSPAMIGRDLPLQYYFADPAATQKGVYEVDVLVTASRIARGILNVVKGHVGVISIAFAFIIEASEEAHLPETVLCAFQVHSLRLEDCPSLPDCYPDG